MRNYTDRFEENNIQRTKRIDSMLKSMILEASLHSYIFDEPLPRFTRGQIADYCGCSKDYIKRLEESALRKVKSVSAIA